MRYAFQTDDDNLLDSDLPDSDILVSAEGSSWRDNGFVDGFQIHFGEWIKQIVDWTDQNLELPLKIIEWPFKMLFQLLMSDDPNRTAIMDIPWYWVAIAFFIIGAVARNARIGLMVSVMVAVCGLLGPDYWSETTKTFGMVFIAVAMCAIVGIPLGVLCGRVDAAWNVVRPVLDGMQVVHSFVYMLPFIFFWKVGEISATMVTMVFALPPLVRLTNLGIRQVPEDVVEASRSYGATERRVLTDVQLPLARPAIMTGLNQTLLAAIAMLGIAALMGAGGLGKLLLRAINSQNLPLAASGGLAFFLVAVVLDRISQREGDDDISLLGRIREAYAYRKDPTGLLDAQAGRVATAEAEAVVESAAEAAEAPAPMPASERTGLLLSAVGSLVALVSVFLPWGIDSGLVSSWGRRADETELIGQSSMGIEATGGSVFAVSVLLLSFLAFAAASRPLFSFGSGASRFFSRVQGVLFGVLGVGAVLAWVINMFGADLGLISTIGLIVFGLALTAVALETWTRGTARLGADGAAVAALGSLGAVVGYFLLQPSDFVQAYSHQVGLYVALAGTGLAVAGALMALFAAPYAPRRPLKLTIAWPLVAGAVFGLGFLFVGTISGWMFDGRLESLITPEMQAEIDQLRADAGDDMNLQIANGQTISNMINLAQSQDTPVYNSFDADGPGLGFPVLIFGVLASIAALFAAGLFGQAEKLRWWGATLATGLASGVVAICLSWILSLTRSAEPNAISGAGAAFAAMAGVLMFMLGRSVLGEFRRRKVYGPAQVTDLTAVVDSGASGHETGADTLQPV